MLYVCVYVSIYIYIYTYIYIYIHIYIYTYVFECVHLCLYIYMWSASRSRVWETWVQVVKLYIHTVSYFVAHRATCTDAEKVGKVKPNG